ncbi:DUF742 domain-containing protein [Streptomyces spectabilis]|uniref:DUF742 domain-containing protein n=1 Tax=Streptomyces spectabilis TaxID=68270 RepID=A0A5P2XD52_STRST|nr:DUF742 domain-containing protein [Streptomyces spectabilis]MCI3905372.1 DUF742 domain-containing protein [Streptomyces spectabilis]QEV62368.1 DUF742 domain-containing protein [Streptomyces spectabilis]GGU98898.1 hypothetical protein GCM10010245_01270 [Streptomyces spectabilis]
MAPGTVSEEEYVAATPPDGSSSANWPSGRGQGQGDGSQNRYNFPSAPSHRRQPQYRQPGPQAPAPGPYDKPAPGAYEQPAPGPYDRPAPGAYDQQRPYAPRIRPAQAQRRSPEPAPAANPLVRPYAMTGGRTRPRYQLAIEALVHTTAQPHQLQGQLPEHQRICNLCREIKSVAEISALLSIPLGVARILVADLAEAGLVAIHQPGGDESAGGQPDVTLLERVLSGLRKL